MKKLYAVAYVEISNNRSQKLKQVFNDDAPINFDWVVNNQAKITRHILKAKCYKRSESAHRLCDELNSSTDKIRFAENQTYQPRPNAWVSPRWTMDPAKGWEFRVVDITEKWNFEIDAEVQDIRKKSELKIKRLISKKIV